MAVTINAGKKISGLLHGLLFDPRCRFQVESFTWGQLMKYHARYR